MGVGPEYRLTGLLVSTLYWQYLTGRSCECPDTEISTEAWASLSQARPRRGQSIFCGFSLDLVFIMIIYHSQSTEFPLSQVYVCTICTFWTEYSRSRVEYKLTISPVFVVSSYTNGAWYSWHTTLIPCLGPSQGEGLERSSCSNQGQTGTSHWPALGCHHSCRGGRREGGGC